MITVNSISSTTSRPGSASTLIRRWISQVSAAVSMSSAVRAAASATVAHRASSRITPDSARPDSVSRYPPAEVSTMPAAARLASLDESVARGMRGSPRLIPVKVVAPRSSFGSASNAVALQVGGALGVAVIGSVLSTRYQDHMSTALAGRHVPAAATHTILASLGGALAVAADARGAAGALLAHTARAAFMSGNQVALAVGAVVALGGAILVIARLPSRVPRDTPDPGADS